MNATASIPESSKPAAQPVEMFYSEQVDAKVKTKRFVFVAPRTARTWAKKWLGASAPVITNEHTAQTEDGSRWLTTPEFPVAELFAPKQSQSGGRKVSRGEVEFPTRERKVRTRPDTFDLASDWEAAIVEGRDRDRKAVEFARLCVLKAAEAKAREEAEARRACRENN